MIEVRNLTKQYRELKAVDNISFTIEKGEILGFLGPNGAGKTTTMRMITGYLSPTGGAVYIGGENVFDDPINVKRRIGYLPETPPLYLDMTVKTYLKHITNLKGVPARLVKSEVERVAKECGIDEVAHRLIRHLSKGYRQRVGLAQSLIGSPEILVLDEPTVGLDPAQIREIRSLIKNLAKKHTIILSTHILSEVTMICDRVAIIYKGKIVASDTIENLGRALDDEIRVRIELAKPHPKVHEHLKKMKGIETVDEIEKDSLYEVILDDPTLADGKLVQELVGLDVEIQECINVTPTLEDIYLRIISGQAELSEENGVKEDKEGEAEESSSTSKSKE